MYFRESFKIIVYQLACFGIANTHTLGQSESGYAVYYAKIGLLGLLALLVGNIVDVFLPYLCSSGTMYVDTLPERLYHIFITRQMRHDSQLYLTVIG